MSAPHRSGHVGGRDHPDKSAGPMLVAVQQALSDKRGGGVRGMVNCSDATTIAFMVQSDSYHLGQVAFPRRQLGTPPMSYTRSDAASASAAPLE